MIITKLEIENFQSYYGLNVFELNDGLNLIIGDNGDGKSTIFRALYWLFNTGAGNKANIDLASKKMLTELQENETQKVGVKITFEHDGKKELEKSFLITKKTVGFTTSEYSFSGIVEFNTGEKLKLDGVEVLENRCGFKHTIRKYCLFEGENAINLFDEDSTEKDTALKNLVELFSQVKDYDPYLDIALHCEKKSNQAATNALKADSKNEKEEFRLRCEKDTLARQIGDLNKKYLDAKKEYESYSQKIENLASDKESRELINLANNKIKKINEQISLKLSQLKEDYSKALLDDMYILCGLQPFMKSFFEKTSNFDKAKREENQQYIIDVTKKKTQKDIEKATGFVELPWYMPNEKTMKEMLDEHVCKVCGRPALEGSDAFAYMKKRYEDYLEHESKKSKSKEDIPILFKYDHISDLNRFGIQMELENQSAPTIEDIKERMSVNKTIRSDIEKLKEDMEEIQTEKARIIGQSALKSEQAIINEDENFRVWAEKKEGAYESMILNKSLLEDKRKGESELNDRYDKLAKGKTAQSTVATHKILEMIMLAFEKAKKKNVTDFLDTLEKKANEYLSKLNVDNFTGVIRFVPSETADYVNVYLHDKYGMIVKHPNKSLEITENMSVLFAISELTKIKRDNDYPLIFDAPTSSFGEVKEKDFYSTVSKLKKQCIIATKSFLKIDPNTGKSTINMNEINSFKCTAYRIKQDESILIKDDPSTIQTIVTKIK